MAVCHFKNKLAVIFVRSLMDNKVKYLKKSRLKERLLSPAHAKN